MSPLTKSGWLLLSFATLAPVATSHAQTATGATLTVGNATSSSGITISNGALSTTSTGSLSLTGGTLIGTNNSSSGTLVLNGATVSGTVNMGTISGGLTLNNTSVNDSYTLNAAGLVALGTGTTVLTGANTYTGGTIISAGTLTATGSLTLPTGLLTCTTLGTTPRPLMGPLAPVFTGSLTVSGGSLTLNGNTGGATLITTGSLTNDYVQITATYVGLPPISTGSLTIVRTGTLTLGHTGSLTPMGPACTTTTGSLTLSGGVGPGVIISNSNDAFVMPGIIFGFTPDVIAGGILEVTFASVNGHTYSLEVTAAHNGWTTLVGDITGDGTDLTVTIPATEQTLGTCYRISDVTPAP